MEIITWCILLATLLASLLGALYSYFSVQYKYWKKKGVPHLEPTFPAGNVSDLLLSRKCIQEVYRDIYNKFQGQSFAGMYQFHTPMLLVLDPELIKTILVRDFEHFHDRGIDFDENIEPLGANLVQLNGSRWKELRAKLSPTFTSGKMRMIMQLIVDCSKELVNYMEEPARRQEAVEVKDVLAKFTTDVLASTAFGIQCNCLKDPDAEFRRWGRKLLSPRISQKFRNLLYLTVPKLAIALGIPNNPTNLTNFFTETVKETIKYREKNNVKRNDFLQLLMQLMDKKKIGIEEKELGKGETGDVTITLAEAIAQAVIFLIAGYETSATTMRFCLYELALNPDIQDRLKQEIDAVLEKHNGIITYDAIQEMSYLDNVVSETLRKHSPIPLLIRQCTKEYKIPGSEIVVEKGCHVVVPTSGLHYDPKYFPEPTRFDPDRFTEEVKRTRHHYSYLPFGEGPRICIGIRFALLQTKVGLASLLSKYQFEVCEKTPMPLIYDPKSLMLFMKGGTWLQVMNRSH